MIDWFFFHIFEKTKASQTHFGFINIQSGNFRIFLSLRKSIILYSISYFVVGNTDIFLIKSYFLLLRIFRKDFLEAKPFPEVGRNATFCQQISISFFLSIVCRKTSEIQCFTVLPICSFTIRPNELV